MAILDVLQSKTQDVKISDYFGVYIEEIVYKWVDKVKF